MADRLGQPLLDQDSFDKHRTQQIAEVVDISPDRGEEAKATVYQAPLRVPVHYLDGH
ncbi:hypothetical protein BDK89_4118 [Ilumatobacter fluminis]|uniref:Uncharacterized protein n=1 Tax=Ilumatobacter fluminis TaxID=467091 RepID=A0A4R7I498_9ACTN|nr:hypothetical protein [Ilumatobacter fluminis]TDT18497.1 hypothetical protein BDK89_4118 [Ilumatobacter fluminis]